jgi:hypothetical protein
VPTIRLPLEATQGTEFRRRFRTYGDRLPDGTPVDPVDLTLYSVSMIVRERQWIGAFELAHADADNGGIVNAGPLGYFDVIIPPSALSFDDGFYFYWLSLWPTDAPERVQTWLHGPFVVLPGIVPPTGGGGGGDS